MYNKLLKECENEGITVAYDNLEQPVNGFYLRDGSSKTIILAERLKDNLPLRNVVLAEELGHHYTLPKNNVCCKYWSRLDRANFDKFEGRAIRWAAYKLIPHDAIVQAVQDGINTLPALAERWCVTPGMVLLRLSMPDCKIV